jgi:hypothetical protein
MEFMPRPRLIKMKQKKRLYIARTNSRSLAALGMTAKNKTADDYDEE